MSAPVPPPEPHARGGDAPRAPRPARSLLAPLLCAALALGLAACEAEGEPATAGLPTDAGEPAEAVPEAVPETVEARFEDGYRLQIDAMTLAPGRLALRVENATGTAHALAIAGDPAPAGPPTEVPAGEIRTTEVELEPGPKVVYCPVEDHADRGERVDVVVGD